MGSGLLSSTETSKEGHVASVDAARLKQGTEASSSENSGLTPFFSMAASPALIHELRSTQILNTVSPTPTIVAMASSLGALVPSEARIV